MVWSLSTSDSRTRSPLFVKGYKHPFATSSLVHLMLAGVKGMYESSALNWVHRRRALDEMCGMIAPKGQPAVVGFDVVMPTGEEESGPGPVISGQPPDMGSSGQSPGTKTSGQVHGHDPQTSGSGTGSGVQNNRTRSTGQGARSGCGPGWSPLEQICDRLRRQPGVTLVGIDERGCEMTCNDCWNALILMCALSAVPDAEDPSKRTMQMTDVHCLLQCRHTSGEGVTLVRCGESAERGANAAKNVLMLTQCHIDGVHRPLPFQ